MNTIVSAIGGPLFWAAGALVPLQVTPGAALDLLGRIVLYILLTLLVLLAVALAVFAALALRIIVRDQKGPVVSGREALIGATGTAISELQPTGIVHVRGEIWTAIAQGRTIHRGESVQVVGIEGLRLEVVAQEKVDTVHS